MFLMHEEDRYNKGFLDLNLLKQRIDQHINEAYLRIALQSKLKEIVEENVVEDTET